MGAWFILSPVVASLEYVAGFGVTGMTTWVLGLGILVLSWPSVALPRPGVFFGIAMIVLAVLALLLSNLGGWLIGTANALVAAALLITAGIVMKAGEPRQVAAAIARGTQHPG